MNYVQRAMINNETCTTGRGNRASYELTEAGRSYLAAIGKE
jgi:DNA-binding PadR family transcriptional regulator